MPRQPEGRPSGRPYGRASQRNRVEGENVVARTTVERKLAQVGGREAHEAAAVKAVTYATDVRSFVRILLLVLGLLAGVAALTGAGEFALAVAPPLVGLWVAANLGGWLVELSARRLLVALEDDGRPAVDREA